MADPLYRDPAAPVAARVRDLLARMTLTEKVGQVNQRMYGWHAYERTACGAWGIEVTGRDNGFSLRDTAEYVDFVGPHVY
ncbi:hypothetical protein ACWGSA_19020, partial [Streptomyces diastaticus]